MLKSILRFLSVMALGFLLPNVSFAYEIPREEGYARYFYLFGPQGNPYDGKSEEGVFHVYVDVPAEGADDDVVISVYDADTGGSLDAGVAPWNTEMEYTVTGDSKLDSKKVGEDSTLNKANLQFGPYKKSQGKREGNFYRFTLDVKALSGDDLNLFSVKIKPDYAQSFSYHFNYTLRTGRGNSAYFYPQIPAGVSQITVKTYDVDADGGRDQIYDFSSRQKLTLNDSKTGQWAETSLNIASVDAVRRLEYKVTTTDQINGHAGLEVLDSNGKQLPIYFRKKDPGVSVKPAPKPAPAPKQAPAPKAPTNACNTFVFDGTESYDQDDDKLKYLWDFGDGNTSEEPRVTHTYAKGGTYNVKLRVVDSSGLECNSGSGDQTVDVNTPPVAGFSAPDLVCSGSEVTLKGSATKDGQPAQLTYLWKFSDGTTAEGETVTKTFSKGGVYDVLLSVDDNKNSSCSRDSIRKTIRVNTAPVAVAGKEVEKYFSSSKGDYVVKFDGSKSSDSDRNSLTYSWNFGDGESAEGAKVQHEYKNPGNYTAKLTVNDGTGLNCSVDVASVPVRLNKSPIASIASPEAVCQGSSVTLDASSSVGESGENLSYAWDFGDGSTGTGKSVTHNYAKGGRYTVKLTVDDGLGTPVSVSTTAQTVSVDSQVSAQLAKPEKGCVNQEVVFDASATDTAGQGVKYTWDFGDGTQVTGGSKVSHRYQKGGNYDVRVTVDTGKGNACSTSAASTRVSINTAPIANAGDNLTCCQDDTSKFDGTASSDPDGDSLTYRWDFGDGNTSTDAKVNHEYKTHGKYRVNLVVDDGSGTSCSSSASGFVADVNARPVPVIKVQQK